MDLYAEIVKDNQISYVISDNTVFVGI